MMEQRITFRKNDYDPFIDYLKGVCILFIILTHCFPDYLIDYTQFDLWGRTAVPLLLLLQVFHAYKKGLEQSRLNSKRVWKRVIFPFFLTEAIIFILFPLVNSDVSYIDLRYNLFWGGIGPGCYYPWIYVEMAVILPLCAFIFKKVKGMSLLIFFIFLSQLLEIAVCVLDFPEWLFRLSFFKYTFLIYLGYYLTKEGLVINVKTICLSIVSMLTILFFRYSQIDLRPFFCTQFDVWAIFHWVCYFYMAYLFLYLLQVTFRLIIKHDKVFYYIKRMGEYSYEIFLFQLFYFSICANYVYAFVSTFAGKLLADFLCIIIAVVLCIVPVLFVKIKTSR